MIPYEVLCCDLRWMHRGDGNYWDRPDFISFVETLDKIK